MRPSATDRFFVAPIVNGEVAKGRTINFTGAGFQVIEHPDEDETELTFAANPASPTGTGFVHTTSGSIDGASKLVENADVAANAAISVSKLAPGTAAQILVVNSGGTAWVGVSLSGDASITDAGVITVSKVNGITVSGTPAAGAVLRATSASAAAWGQLDLADTDAVTGVLPTGNQAAQTIGGDGSGTTAALTVTKVQGKAFSASTPTAGDTWGYNGTSWVLVPVGVVELDDATFGVNDRVLSKIVELTTNDTTPGQDYYTTIYAIPAGTVIDCTATALVVNTSDASVDLIDIRAQFQRNGSGAAAAIGTPDETIKINGIDQSIHFTLSSNDLQVHIQAAGGDVRHWTLTITITNVQT